MGSPAHTHTDQEVTGMRRVRTARNHSTEIKREIMFPFFYSFERERERAKKRLHRGPGGTWCWWLTVMSDDMHFISLFSAIRMLGLWAKWGPASQSLSLFIIIDVSKSQFDHVNCLQFQCSFYCNAIVHDFVGTENSAFNDICFVFSLCPKQPQTSKIHHRHSS